MAAPMSGTVYFQVDFVGIKDLPTRLAFLKAAVDEDIGTAISRLLAREDLMSTRVDDVKESMSYSCGSNLFFEEDPLFSEIFVRESLSCRSEIETSYYSAVSHKFAPICIHCGSTDILGNEEEPIISLKKNYSIVRPICQDCITAGQTPITRNQLKVNAKKK